MPSYKTEYKKPGPIKVPFSMKQVYKEDAA